MLRERFYCETCAKRNSRTDFSLSPLQLYEKLKPDRLEACLTGGISVKSSGRGQKLVAVDACGNAAPAVVGFDAHDFRKASNVDVAGHGDFAGQSQDELDGRSRREIRFNQKIRSAETDVPRLSLPFAAARLGGTNR